MAPSRSHLESFAHSEPYAEVPKEFRTAGTSGVVIVECDLPSGQYKRPAADELCLPMVLSAATRHIKVDHGTCWEADGPSANELFLAPRETDLSYTIDGPQRVLIAILPSRFVGFALRGERGPAWSVDFGRLHTSGFSDRTIAELMLRAWREGQSRTRESALVADTAWNSVAALLLQASGQTLPPIKRGGLAGWQLRRITEYIQDRVSEDVSLNDLADLVGLSPRHLCTAFRESTGLPPHRWQVERRIERAEAMLGDATTAITEVALACGFGTPSHFATVFRRATGRTPSDWRRERVR